MKATKDHISFETAKLLEEYCSMAKSIFDYSSQCNKDGTFNMEIYKNDSYGMDIQGLCLPSHPPAFTWQEILWEKSEEFFGKKLLCYDCGEEVGKPLGNERIQIGTGTCYCGRQFENNEEACEFHAKNIIFYLQQKLYEQADNYFRKNTILISK